MATPGDCPQCLSLCVGAHALPCGHPVCRKCLRDHYGFQLICNICNQSLALPRSKGPEDFTSLVQQLEVDLVTITPLVDQRLKGQGRQSCVMCETRYSTTMCHDCKEQYCDGCAKVHRRLGLTKDHVLQTLPQEEFMFGAAASSQVSRRHLVTTPQSSTSPTQVAVSSPSAPASSTSSQGPPSQRPSLTQPTVSSPSASSLTSQGPALQRPFLTQPAVLFTIVVFAFFYTVVVLYTCVFPTVGQMKANPRRVFTMTPACDDDKYGSWITSIVSIEDGQRLVMSDVFNRKVKVVDMHHPHKVSASLSLFEQPMKLAVLPDNVIAVTTENKVIYLLQVTDTVTVTSRIKTDMRYGGIAVHSDGNLIVIGIGSRGVTRMDILSRSGRVVRTIADSHSLQLDSGSHLYLKDNHVYVSDFNRHAVLKVDLNTGQLLDTITHTELKYPSQITADTSGHLYFASWESQPLLVLSPSGQWRKLVEASQHSEQGYDFPCAVCVTSSGRLIVAWFRETDDSSVVIAYDL